MRELFAWIGVAVLLVVGAFAVTGAGWFNYSFWGPKFENTRHAIFKESQTYQDGATKNLARLQLEYETADEGHKKALRTMILTEMSVVDESTLPANLRAFIAQLRRGGIEG